MSHAPKLRAAEIARNVDETHCEHSRAHGTSFLYENINVPDKYLALVEVTRRSLIREICTIRFTIERDLRLL